MPGKVVSLRMRQDLARIDRVIGLRLGLSCEFFMLRDGRLRAMPHDGKGGLLGAIGILERLGLEVAACRVVS